MTRAGKEGSSYHHTPAPEKGRGHVVSREKARQRENLLGDAKQALWIARTSGDTRQTKDVLLYK